VADLYALQYPLSIDLKYLELTKQSQSKLYER
jgi:hypothetical protein